MEPDSARRLSDSNADLDQPQSQRFDSRPAEPGVFARLAQFVHQGVGRRMQDQPEEVGDETMAAQAVSGAIQLEILDPVFARLAALDVELPVDPRRRLVERRHHKPLIVLVFQPFGLGNHPPGGRPRSGLIPAFGIDRRFALGHRREQPRRLHRRLREFVEVGVFRDAEHVVDAMRFEFEVEILAAIAGVAAHDHLHAGPFLTNAVGQVDQQPVRAQPGRNPPGTQKRQDQIAGFAIVNQHRLIAVMPIIAVEFGKLLLPVGLVVGGIHVEDDPAIGRSLAMLQPVIHQGLQQTLDRVVVRRVFQASQRGLASQVIVGIEFAVTSGFQGRIRAEPVGVVGVFVTAADLEHPAGAGDPPPCGECGSGHGDLQDNRTGDGSGQPGVPPPATAGFLRRKRWLHH